MTPALELMNDMLKTAALAAGYLGAAADDIRGFITALRTRDGGFHGRGDASDLYYTSFAIDCLLALGTTPADDGLIRYVDSFDTGDSLDFMHCTCLARCWTRLRHPLSTPPNRSRLLSRIESFRTPDGGYNAIVNSPNGAIHGCYLALGAYNDLGKRPPRPGRIADCIKGLRADDGGFGSTPGMHRGTTIATAGVMLLRSSAGLAANRDLARWILARHLPVGGFAAHPEIDIPDLVSTSVALYSLTMARIPLVDIRGACLDFVESLWDERGAFNGSCYDNNVDSEYTFYGLLALGCLTGSANK